ncbi:hypothetical protein PIB30_082924, partial [Stylosanthes scabra]|nr:hypothetical protein [Stylosanthes scabra]
NIFPPRPSSTAQNGGGLGGKQHGKTPSPSFPTLRQCKLGLPGSLVGLRDDVWQRLGQRRRQLWCWGGGSERAVELG